MSILFITYDLINPGQNYEILLKNIKAYGAWAKLGESAYLVETNSLPTTVRDNLSKALDNNDKLFVGTIVSPAAWHSLPDAVSNWILERLK